MPMAGAGSRFANAGYTIPKPLIEVDGIPMFLKALSSLDNIPVEKRYIFVIRQEHVESQGLDSLIKSALSSAQIVVLPEITRGAAETVLSAERLLNDEEPLILLDCDLWFRSKSYDQMVLGVLDNSNDTNGGLLTFEADNPRYSYAKIDDCNIVTETAEKKVISHNAITGAYFFAKAKEFKLAAKELLDRPLNEEMPEYYLSLLYNILIDEGKKIQAAYVDEFESFGTPEELAIYENH